MSQESLQGLLPRVRFRPRLSIFGMLWGGVFGLGLVILGQQFGRVYLGRTNLAAFILGGVIGSLVLANLWRLASISRMNGIISKAEDRLTLRLAESGGIEPEASAGPPGPPAQAGGLRFAATHVVPSEGLDAYPEPDPSLDPVARLDGGVSLKVTEYQGEWASVLAENGWSGWVDSRELVQIP
jgi:hypothetical protein